MPTYDTIVLGLGGMGSAAAYHLAARGRRVLGVERYGPAHDRGSSHGGSRIIRKAYFEGPSYVPLLLRAYQMWDRLERDSGRSLRTTTGGLWLGPADSAAVAGSRDSATGHGLPHEVLDATEIRRRFPMFAPDDGVLGLYEPDAGVLAPEAAVSAHLELAARAGAELRFGEAVRSWRAGPSGVEVVTGTGTYPAGGLVLTPGAWAPELLAGLGLPLTVKRQVQVWLGGERDGRYPGHPVFVWEDSGLVSYGVPPVEPGAGVKVGFHHGGVTCTPETMDRTVRPEEVTAVRDHVRRLLPGLPVRLLRAAACPYTNTPDEHFVIGRHPRGERVVFGCGFSGHGFKFVPVVGEVLADLAVDGTTGYPIETFDPARFARSLPTNPPSTRTWSADS